MAFMQTAARHRVNATSWKQLAVGVYDLVVLVWFMPLAPVTHGK